MQNFNFKLATGVFAALSGALALTSSAVYAASEANLPVVQQELVAPPAMPAPITRKTPARVVVNLTVEEVEKEIAPALNTCFGPSAAPCRAR
jgi:nitrite reductase (NO-forming)